MRILIPKFDSKKSLFEYLVKNKSDLILQKKSLPIFGDPTSFGETEEDDQDHIQTKANKPVSENVDQLNVRVVCNTANWMDNHDDVLLPGGAKKSIQERKKIIPHLHDHIHQLVAKVGIPTDIKLEELSFRELGIKGKGVGTAEAVVMYSTVMRSLNEQVFEQYKSGQITQHSVGMQYVKIRLAINDEDYKSEFETWQTYFDSIINKEVAESKGYFWAISEWKFLENSAVLFGSNEITPTLANNLKVDEPGTPTPDEPDNSTKEQAERKKSFLLQSINQIK